MKVEIEKLVKWSEAKRVETKHGPRMLRKAAPTDEFSAAWKSNKDALKAAGISWSKDERTGEWLVCWWAPLDAGTVAKETAAVEASKATDADVNIPAPDGLAYLGFQKAGIKFMSERPATLLCDSVGLGKTVQAIGVINMDASLKKILVVCPATLKTNWRNELKRWLTHSLKVAVQVAGQPWIGDHVDVVVINYDVLGKFPQLYSREWDLLVADECHAVKSRNALRTKLLLGAVKKADKEKFPGVRARRKVFMTATPILNKPIELFPLLESLQPGQWTFKDKIKYCAGFEGRWGWDFTGAAHLDELQIRLRSSIMCRRLKSEVMKELPPIRRQLIELAPNGKAGLVEQEREEFERHENKLRRLKAAAEVARLGDGSDYTSAAAALRDATNIAFAEIAKMRHALAMAKVPSVIEHVRDILEDTRKLVCFVHHHDVCDSIAAGLAEHGVLIVDGRTPNDQRQEIVDQFNAGDSKRVLLLGIRAAGVGLSIRASVELFAELDWTPGIIEQAEGRCHGVGRGIEGEPLLVQHLVFDGSLDSRMVQVLVAKQEIADKALDKGASLAQASEPILSVEIGSVIADKPEQSSVVVTDTLREHVHDGLKRLAACDHDWAMEVNGSGFSKMDGAFGHALAEQSRLSDKQTLAGIRLVTRYRRQLGESYGATLKELVQ